MQRPEVRERFLNAVRNRSEEWNKNLSKALTGHKGHQMSDEAKEKLRQINLGNKYGLGNKSRTGQTASEETRKKLSEAGKRVVHTPEWNKKVGDALRGKKRTEEQKEKMRGPRPKYKWLLPDGSFRIMDSNNGSRHEGWIKLELVE